ncbi:hypothetical protein K503DRAFT_285100 [Rhizopogon vinicolor AM-OR11-026]|uniref:Uncharacterized protein n=1 Tax=Rhizopogon vinicolor AM-OR11-026 TaxID=1314800 RepID=A0A1B7NDA7_9AGAM|nr:hypothetical protein K503DRAFT_285100 [Rhizopogon vinicolor AM-OR11-026]
MLQHLPGKPFTTLQWICSWYTTLAWPGQSSLLGCVTRLHPLVYSCKHFSSISQSSPPRHVGSVFPRLLELCLTYNSNTRHLHLFLPPVMRLCVLDRLVIDLDLKSIDLWSCSGDLIHLPTYSHFLLQSRTSAQTFSSFRVATNHAGLCSFSHPPMPASLPQAMSCWPHL